MKIKLITFNHQKPRFAERPKNCVCADSSWTIKPLKICSDYKPDIGDTCENCEHDKACHTPRE